MDIISIPQFLINKIMTNVSKRTKTKTFVFVVALKIRGGEWSLKNLGSRKIFHEFHRSRSLVFFSGYVRLAVSILSQSCLGVSIFCKAKKVSKSRFVC